MNAKRAPPKPRGRRPVVQDFDLREHLLDTATLLFAERGIAATTVAQIAAGAGATSALVHYYFMNRETLLDAVADERLTPAMQFVWGWKVDDSPDDPFAMVQEIVGRLFDVTGRMPWLPPLWLREIVNEGGLLRERMMKRIPVDNIKRFAARIAHAQQDGTVNPELEAALLFNSVLAVVMLPLATARIWQNLRGIPPIERDALQRHAIALLMGGMHLPVRSARKKRRASSGSKP